MKISKVFFCVLLLLMNNGIGCAATLNKKIEYHFMTGINKTEIEGNFTKWTKSPDPKRLTNNTWLKSKLKLNMNNGSQLSWSEKGHDHLKNYWLVQKGRVPAVEVWLKIKGIDQANFKISKFICNYKKKCKKSKNTSLFDKDAFEISYNKTKLSIDNLYTDRHSLKNVLSQRWVIDLKVKDKCDDQAKVSSHQEKEIKKRFPTVSKPDSDFTVHLNNFKLLPTEIASRIEFVDKKGEISCSKNPQKKLKVVFPLGDIPDGVALVSNKGKIDIPMNKKHIFELDLKQQIIEGSYVFRNEFSDDIVKQKVKIKFFVPQKEGEPIVLFSTIKKPGDDGKIDYRYFAWGHDRSTIQAEISSRYADHIVENISNIEKNLSLKIYSIRELIFNVSGFSRNVTLSIFSMDPSRKENPVTNLATKEIIADGNVKIFLKQGSNESLYYQVIGAGSMSKVRKIETGTQPIEIKIDKELGLMPAISQRKGTMCVYDKAGEKPVSQAKVTIFGDETGGAKNEVYWMGLTNEQGQIDYSFYGDDRAGKLKYHIETSGYHPHEGELPDETFAEIRIEPFRNWHPCRIEMVTCSDDKHPGKLKLTMSDNKQKTIYASTEFLPPETIEIAYKNEHYDQEFDYKYKTGEDNSYKSFPLSLSDLEFPLRLSILPCKDVKIKIVYENQKYSQLPLIKMNREPIKDASGEYYYRFRCGHNEKLKVKYHVEANRCYKESNGAVRIMRQSALQTLAIELKPKPEKVQVLINRTGDQDYNGKTIFYANKVLHSEEFKSFKLDIYGHSSGKFYSYDNNQGYDLEYGAWLELNKALPQAFRNFPKDFPIHLVYIVHIDSMVRAIPVLERMLQSGKLTPKEEEKISVLLVDADKEIYGDTREQIYKAFRKWAKSGCFEICKANDDNAIAASLRTILNLN